MKKTTETKTDPITNKISALGIDGEITISRIINIQKDVSKEWHDLEPKEYLRGAELVKKVWQKLSDEDSSFHPLFDSVMVSKIISRVTANVIDNRSNKPKSGNGSNLLITGIRGVGKTTLMRGLCTVLSNLQGHKLITVYYDYELNPPVTLTQLLLESFESSKDRELPQTIQPDDKFATLLQKLCYAGFRVAMFLDEIQTLFVPNNHPDYIRNLEITREILKLGKSEFHCFGVLSGSSSNVRNLAYHEDPLAKEGRYPNLNNNVYCEYELRPVRDRNEMLEIIPEYVDVDKCFFMTGGVGRSINNYIFSRQYYEIPSHKFREELVENDAFFALISQLVNGPKEGNWELTTLQFHQVKDIVVPRLRDNFQLFSQILKGWIDSGFLYQTSHNSYQLLVPGHAQIFKSYISASNDDNSGALRAAALGTISNNGWDNEGSAGNILEKYICRRLCEADTAPLFWEKLAEEGPERCVSQARISQAIEDKIFLGSLMRPKRDNGIDGVFICSDPEDDNSYQLHTLQIKCGRLHKSITKGGSAAEKPNNPNDKVMRGIVCKAKRGISSLLKNLRNIKINKASFTVCTTKRVNPHAKEFLLKGFQVDCLNVESYLLDQQQTLDLFESWLRNLISK
eukprot:gb/GECH01001424.1/.p1 GENE.gb/GECH01001424.1/~~gb/GECH01001424.1/.p1  ORF type:complete len:626 (+),score=48.08 gb/GECH01001424.1/:1-1878(+)